MGIQAEVGRLELDILQHARRKTTQKVNLFEKVQIPGLKEAILKIKRYLEDEESLSKRLRRSCVLISMRRRRSAVTPWRQNQKRKQ